MQKLLSSLIQHDKIVTTQTKAKALKREVERLISRSKSLNLTVRVLATFSQKKVAEKFLSQVVPQFKERVGGYVRVVKLPPRRGDQAPLARVEFVEEIKGAVEKKAEPKAAAAKTPAKKPAAKSAARKPAKKAPAKRSAKKK